MSNRNSHQPLLRDTQIQELLGIFSKLMPAPRSELNFSNDYELIIAVVLSAQCTDKKVNQVTTNLFALFPDFGSLAQADPNQLESTIRQINYFKTKAKNIRALALQVTTEHAGMLPTTRSELEELPGVGRKTASVILSEKGIEPALAVDTHVFRVSQRLGLAKSSKREVVEEQLRCTFPKEQWRNLHHWLILHGRRTCKAQTPLCGACALAGLCPSFNLNSSVVRAALKQSQKKKSR
jgi:endonuclease-3